MNRKIVAFVLTIVMMMTMIPVTAMAAAADRFVDVEKDDWYYTFVDFVTEKGYFSGTSAVTFSPEMTMTRAMFVTVLANMEQVKVDNSTTGFADVPVDQWYTGAAKWAVENKIVSGYAEGKFCPDNMITREEMCVIMNNYINYYSAKNNVEHEKKGSTTAFPDAAQVSAWAKDAVNNCRAYGLVDGFEDGAFRPKNESTRAQVATVIYKLAWLVKEQEWGGGSGGSTGGNTGGNTGGEPGPATTYGSYTLSSRLNLNGQIASGNGSNRPLTLTGSVDYEVSDTVYTVMMNYVSKNEDTYKTAFNKAVGAAKARGLLMDNGMVKYIGVPMDHMGEGGGDVTEHVVSDVAANIKNDNTVKEALKDAGITTEAIDDHIDEVIEAIVSGSGLEFENDTKEEAEQKKVVIDALVDKIDNVTKEKVEEILAKPEYDNYQQLVSDMAIDLEHTINAYKEQLEAMQKDLQDYLNSLGLMRVFRLGRSAGAPGADEVSPEAIYYLKANDKKLQTFVLIDPIAIMNDQYELHVQDITDRITGPAVASFMAIADPHNLINADRTVKDADDYVQYMKDMQEALYDMSKEWVAVDNTQSRDEIIDIMVDESLSRAGIGSQISGGQLAFMKKVTTALYGEGANTTGGGFDMTMETFVETVLNNNIELDLTKTPEQNDSVFGDQTLTIPTMDVHDVPETNLNETMKLALEVIKGEYPDAKIGGSIYIDWDAWNFN